MLEPLVRYARDETVTYTVIHTISIETRKWYFQNGGIYLTERSREPYFDLKKAMQPVLDAAECKSQPDKEIDPQQLERIVAAGSTLRTVLSDDIGTKRLSRV